MKASIHYLRYFDTSFNKRTAWFVSSAGMQRSSPVLFEPELLPTHLDDDFGASRHLRREGGLSKLVRMFVVCDYSFFEISHE